jgi:hypothetical protein
VASVEGLLVLGRQLNAGTGHDDVNRLALRGLLDPDHRGESLDDRDAPSRAREWTPVGFPGQGRDRIDREQMRPPGMDGDPQVHWPCITLRSKPRSAGERRADDVSIAFRTHRDP